MRLNHRPSLRYCLPGHYTRGDFFLSCGLRARTRRAARAAHRTSSAAGEAVRKSRSSLLSTARGAPRLLHLILAGSAAAAALQCPRGGRRGGGNSAHVGDEFRARRRGSAAPSAAAPVCGDALWSRCRLTGRNKRIYIIILADNNLKSRAKKHQNLLFETFQTVSRTQKVMIGAISMFYKQYTKNRPL